MSRRYSPAEAAEAQGPHSPGPGPETTEPQVPDPEAPEAGRLGPAGTGPADTAGGLSLQDSIYRRTIAVCDRLADAVLRGSDPDELTDVFAALVQKPVVVLDADLRTRAEAGGTGAAIAPRWHRSDPSVNRLLSALDAERRPLRVPYVPGSALQHGCLISPVAVGETLHGYLLVLDAADTGEPDDVELLTTTYAATLFALALANERTSTELGQRYKQAVADALVSGHFLDAEDAREKSRSLGFSDAQHYRVAAVRFDHPGQPGHPGRSDHSSGTDRPPTASQAKTLVDRISTTLPGAVALTRDTMVVALLPADTAPEAERGTTRPRAATTLAGLSHLAGQGSTRVTFGLSEPMDRPDLAPYGRWQAEQAIGLGLRLGRGGQVIRYDELGIYRLLLRIDDLGELQSFADDALGPLLAYDRQHQADLVHTLSVYLRNHGSPKQSARSLRLHVNTVAYRVQRIEQITGLDLADPDDRLVAHVAVKIIESHQSPR